MKPGARIVGAVAALVLVAGGLTVQWCQSAAAKRRAVLAWVPAEVVPAGADPRTAEALREAVRGLGSGGAAGLGRLARIYHANGWQAEAEGVYAGLRELEPGEPRWPYLGAMIAAGYGRLTEAAPLWQEAARLAPEAPWPLLRLGEARLKENSLEEADRAFSAAEAIPGRPPHALVGRARVALARGDEPAAALLLERAVAESDGRIGWDLLGTVYEGMGRMEDADRVRARSERWGAFSDFDDPWLAELNEVCFDAYRLAQAGGVAQASGDLPKALALLRRAVEIAPTDGMARYQLGTALEAAGDRTEAEAEFRRCVAARPDFADGWVRLLALVQERDRAEAARVLEAAIVAAPRSPALHLERARRRAASGDAAGALRDAQTAASLRPNEARAHLEVARLLFAAERIEDGVASLERALAEEPGHPGALTTLCYVSIRRGDRAAADRWWVEVSAQPRIPPSERARLADTYRRQFAASPP